MITNDDRLFCLLLSVKDGTNIGRLNCYSYILQKIGFSLDYSFRINVSGVRSKSFSRYLEDKMSTGLIAQDNGVISISNDSSDMLDNFVLSFDELSIVDNVNSILSMLSDSELYFVCVVDMIMNDVVKTKGLDALVTSRDFIESSVESLCSDYSKDNFNLAVSLLRRLKKECYLHE